MTTKFTAPPLCALSHSLALMKITAIFRDEQIVKMLRPLIFPSITGPLSPELVSFLQVAPVITCQVDHALCLRPTIPRHRCSPSLPSLPSSDLQRSERPDVCASCFPDFSLNVNAALPPLPYFSMAVNGYLWCAYGASNMDMTIISSNVIGLLLSIYYCHEFIKYNKQNDLTTYMYVTGGLIAFISAVAAALPSNTAAYVLGWLGCAVVVAMFGASSCHTIQPRALTSAPQAVHSP